MLYASEGMKYACLGFKRGLVGTFIMSVVKLLFRLFRMIM